MADCDQLVVDHLCVINVRQLLSRSLPQWPQMYIYQDFTAHQSDK